MSSYAETSPVPEIAIMNQLVKVGGSAASESPINQAATHTPPETSQIVQACSAGDSISPITSKSNVVQSVELHAPLTEFTLFPKLPPELRLMVVSIPRSFILNCSC